MIERLIKYLMITYRWVVGVTIELVYPFITFAAAAIICFLFYITLLFQK